jgi:hypothetical protein
MLPDADKMKTVIICGILALFILAGCATTIHVEKKPDGTIVMDSSSTREYEYFEILYDPTTGYFKLIAVGVTDDSSETVQTIFKYGVEVLPEIIP